MAVNRAGDRIDEIRSAELVGSEAAEAGCWMAPVVLPSVCSTMGDPAADERAAVVNKPTSILNDYEDRVRKTAKQRFEWSSIQVLLAARDAIDPQRCFAVR